MSRETKQQANSVHQPLLSNAYLRSVWSTDYEAFRGSAESAALHERLRRWAAKDWQKESSADGTFVDVFFKQTWGYGASGEGPASEGYTLYPEFPVPNAGQGGGTGEADLALGCFGQAHLAPTPQVLGEFKDTKSGLDKAQRRNNRRTPVEQCFDYLKESRRGLFSAVLPTWALVTDMNEFRLYAWGNKAEHQRFVISPTAGDSATALTDDSDAADLQRFLFSRVFHADWLLSTSGRSPLERLLGEQATHEKALESAFYEKYHAYRQLLFAELRLANPAYAERGRLRRLLAITQRLLDRFIFVLYCEDMGGMLNFPRNALRDLLIESAASRFYREDGQQAWSAVRSLFDTMRDGGHLGPNPIHRFNGGLFAADPEIDALCIPNRVFCLQNQGSSPARLVSTPKTLLFFSAEYNFGTSEDGAGKTLTLRAMGRIFEQSITDLEVMEARAEGRVSLSEITKRRRDGVYYTPEWVTKYIVEETIGARLAEIRSSLGFDRFDGVSAEEIAQHRLDARRSPVVRDYERALHAFSAQLNALKVVDPACGSGAFLIQAFRFLYDQRQRVAAELERVTGNPGLFDTHATMRAVLSNNLYGVDINPESVEITRLALWLHTALPDRPLTSLDENIRCGNSLVGTDFTRQLGLAPQGVDESSRERVNPFDWPERFPSVFAGEKPGFDCVIGNPPYVKLQHFRRVQELTARYLLSAKAEHGSPLYQSTQTGNFDLYLPFIEKGIGLLNEDGKLGYIAPNLWMVNEYGEGLRGYVKRTRSLDRWIDFKSYQVFDEATTYTALQFFTAGRSPSVRVSFAPRGPEDIAALRWSGETASIALDELPDQRAWELMPAADRALRERLRGSCRTLEEHSDQIFQGLITSADSIYHLHRLGPGHYVYKPKGQASRVEVEIEDAIMRPLISGKEAARYQEPRTDTWILFPYAMHDGRTKLIEPSRMQQAFPKAWSYLAGFEDALRAREGRKFDDESWYRFGRSQNLDKQHLPKLLVPRIVLRLFAALDSSGSCCLDNVDVNGILVHDEVDALYLFGLLNANVTNFIWRRSAKPFQNDYRAANKQFIAPLPIPHADEAQKRVVGAKARALEDLHTRRAGAMGRLDKRLGSLQCEDDTRDEAWLWAEVKPPGTLKAEAPSQCARRQRTAWAKAERARRLAVHLDGLDVLLQAGADLAVTCEDGELVLLVSGVAALGTYLAPQDAAFVAAQWRQKARRIRVTEKFDGKKLVRQLLTLRRTENAALRQQVVELDGDIRVLDGEIESAEGEMNALVYELYGLTEAEIALVQAG